MTRNLCRFAAACGLLAGALFTETAFAQRQGGIFKVHHWDNPPSMSIHEEATISTVVPMMGVFNNLVLFDQHVASKPRGVDRTRAGDGLVMERGRDGIEL